MAPIIKTLARVELINKLPGETKPILCFLDSFHPFLFLTFIYYIFKHPNG